MKSQKLLDAFTYVDDRYLELAEAPKKKVISLHKKLITLIAAVICVSLLAVTAVAKLPSVYQYMKAYDPQDAELYEIAEEAASDLPPEPVELPQMKEASLVITDKFYNGETILLGLDLKAASDEPAIGFEPDAELMRQIHIHGIPAESWIYEPGVFDTIPYPRGARALAAELKHILTPDQYGEFEKKMEEDGHCCVVVLDVYVGDHILVNGTDMFATYNVENNTSAGMDRNNTPAGEAIRLDPLPQGGKNQPQVTVELDIKSSNVYYYLDADGHAWTYYQFRQSQPATLTIPRTEAAK